MDVGDDGVAMDMGGDGVAEEPPDSATSLSNMIDRIDSQVSNVGRFPESDSESEPTALADGRCDDPEESLWEIMSELTRPSFTPEMAFHLMQVP